MPILAPALLWRDDAFHEGLAIEFDEVTGVIARIAPLDAVLDGAHVVHLRDRALMPGFVNAHSHAFQRLIRGRTQWRPANDGTASFWTWREAMYDAALRLTPDDVYHSARFCFLEMLRAGITTVGEFHYLHNDESGRPYEDPGELARRVIAAAQDVGIRISLLNVCYATAGIRERLRAEQRRFATPELDAFIATTLALHNAADKASRVSAGIAPHSVRAVPREWLPELHAAAAAHDLPLHIHVSEQPAEVAACVAAFGLRPVQLLHADGLLDERVTGVHATHITDEEIELIAGSGATVCACPATERDLGDGLLRAADLLRAGAPIALGTDSQTVIDMFEEARLTEYIERSRRLERVVLTRHAPDENAQLDVAPVLIDMMTTAGARSLQIPTGQLQAGKQADLVAIDLDHLVLAGWTAATLPALLVLSAAADVVSDVWVGGTQVVAQRSHAAQEDAVRSFNVLARRFAWR